MRLIVLFATVIAFSGCTMVYTYKISDRLVFARQEPMPQRVALYIPGSTRKMQYVASESALGMTTVFKTPLGTVLEPNAKRALEAAFKSVTIVADSGRIADSIDVVIILSIDSTRYVWWSEGINVCRRLDVVLKGTVVNRRVAPPSGLAMFTDGECYCKQYQCIVNGKVKGLDASLALITTLAFGLPAVSMNIEGVFRLGTEGALRKALENFVGTIVANKGRLSS